MTKQILELINPPTEPKNQSIKETLWPKLLENKRPSEKQKRKVQSPKKPATLTELKIKSAKLEEALTILNRQIQEKQELREIEETERIVALNRVLVEVRDVLVFLKQYLTRNVKLQTKEEELLDFLLKQFKT